MSNAKPIKNISPNHLENICYWGTKALYTKAAKLALEFGVPLSFHNDQSFEMMTTVDSSDENCLCVTKLNNIGAVVCLNSNIAQGLETLENYFKATSFRVLASAQDEGDSRFLLDFVDYKPEQLTFSETIKPLNLNMNAVSIICSKDLSDEIRKKTMSSLTEFNIKRLLESKNRMTFFVDSEDSHILINTLHQAIVAPSQDKN